MGPALVLLLSGFHLHGISLYDILDIIIILFLSKSLSPVNKSLQHVTLTVHSHLKKGPLQCLLKHVR